MRIGYARVSTEEQHLDLQLDALKSAGCEKTLKDVASGAKTDRDGLTELLKQLRKGDTLVVWRLDRLGRSLKHLIEIITLLKGRGIYFNSLQENIDTSSSGGKLIFHVFGALAEFERDIISERTKAGLASARSRGRVGGRPRIMDDNKLALAKAMLADHSHTIRDVCLTLGVSKATLYRHLKNNGQGNQ